MRTVVLGDVLIRLPFVYGSVDAERTEEDKSLYGHAKLDDGIHEMLCSLGVHASEVGLVYALSHSSSMHYVVKLMVCKLSLQLILGVEVEFDEIYSLVLEVTP